MTTWSDANTGYPNRWFIGVHDSKIKWYNDAGASAIANASNIQLNTWLHVAVARSGSTITLYINGTAIGTQTTSQSYTTQGTVKLGYSGTGGNYFSGYISNARVVKGTAVYTANFTPSTTPLTAITNTSLLTCQSNRFVDNSSNAFAITRNGDVSVQAFSPFNPTAAWDATTYGGSGYFDGSGDFLTAPANSAWACAGDYSVEAWVYIPALSGDMHVFGTGGSGANDQFNVESDGQFYWQGQGSPVGSVVAGMWNHLLATRSGSVFRGFINGVLRTYNASVTGTVGQNATMYIGRRSDGNNSMLGYISNIRYINGSIPTGYQTSSTTLGTQVFTPPTAPFTTTSQGATSGDVKLLTNFTNAGIYDATSKNDLETVGNAQISTTQSKFGGSSMLFDGTGDWLRTPTSPNLNMGTGDLTIEGWFYLTATVAVDYRMIVSDATNGNNYVAIRSGGTGGQLEVNVNGTSFRLNLNNSVTINTWFHLAVTRYNGTWYGFVNGASLGSNASAAAFNLGNGGMFVGRFGGGTAYEWPGYMDDLRITKGIARYTSNFTPPTAAFLTL
jgi:hypothetical protein